MKIKPYISKSKKHLDFGCGFGFFAFLLAKDYPRTKVYGIDIDKKCIKLGKQKYQKSNLQLRCTEKIIGKFDSISTFFVIHHLKKRAENFLKEFHKHLNPEGKIIIFDFRKVPKSKYKGWYDKKFEAGEYKGSFEKSYKGHNQWTIKQFSSLMKSIGFKILESEEVDDLWFLYIGEKI